MIAMSCRVGFVDRFAREFKMIRSSFLAGALTLVLTGTAWAQFGSTTGGGNGGAGGFGGSAGGSSSSSPFGSSSSGFGSNSGTSGGQRGGAASSQSSAFSNSQGLGSGGAGFRGAGSGNMLQSVGGNTGIGGAAIGRNQGMGMNGMGMNGMGMNGMGMNGMGMGRNQMGMMGGQNQNSNRSSRGSIRFPLKIAFQPVAIAPSIRSQRFEARLGNLPGVTSANVTVSMSGRTAILNGTVGSDHEKELIARIALLEPGISDVQNDLQVAASESLDSIPGTQDSP